MKVIISHDVDHIDSVDHLFKDLILEKMFVRSWIQFIQGRLSFRTFIYRITLVFRGRMNRLNEIMEFDKKHHIPSEFFFGVSNTKGMSYSRKKAEKYIKWVYEKGFHVGVHGCEFHKYSQMHKEYKCFEKILENYQFGIRNHYVQYDDNTFAKMAEMGYIFDSSEFNKKEVELKEPYKIGDMWEFPLHIMDCYVLEQGKVDEGIEKTIRLIDDADSKGVEYLTILFHDYQFDDIFDPDSKKWYIKTIEYCEKKNYVFVSYREAIKELENADNRKC